MNAAPVPIAVFAKAPVPGETKTRLIPALGAEGAARLHAQLVHHALATAMNAAIGPVTLWCAPDTTHPFFVDAARRHGVARARQRGVDLGRRMHGAFEHHCPEAPTLLIGTDCPMLTPATLREAAQRLWAGDAAVFIPAEDGGYVLVGLHQAESRLFEDVAWGGPTVMAQTRSQLHACALTWSELSVHWDLDRPEDLPRLNALNPLELAPSHAP